METFGPIDKLLLLSGTQVASNGYYIGIINRIMTLIVSCAGVVTILINSCMLYNYDRYQLMLIANEIYHIGLLCFIFIMNKNRKTLEQDFTFVLHDLPMKHQKSLKKWSVIFTIYIYSRVLRSSLGSIPIFMHHFSGNNFEISLFSCLGILVSFGCCFNASAVYLFIVKVIFFWEVSYFERLSSKLKKIKKRMHNENNFRTFLININKDRIVMNNMKNKLVDSLSFIPIFWFLHIYFYIAGTIVFAQRAEKKNVLLDIMTDGLDIMYELIILVTVMITANQVNDLVKKKSQTVVDFFAQDITYFKIEAGVRDFHYRCNDFQFSVCSLFTLNKKLLLGFLSSLLTFTTLFIQIFDSIYPAPPATPSSSNIK